MSTASGDERVRAVEDNLLALFGAVSTFPVLDNDGHEDVATCHCDVPFPLFNGITGATFDSADRAREVLAPYLRRGLPFMWWLTPSTTSPGIEAALAEAGLEPEQVPGMHRPLDRPLDPAVDEVVGPGVQVRQTTPEEFGVFMDVCLRGFGMPEFAWQPMTDVMASFAPEKMLFVVATADGEPASAGSLYLTGKVGGLYNIATMPTHRGRGLGYAVTARLLELARDHGCTDAVLHATEMGRPVYERAGFVEVCAVPQWVWAPA